jgi:asparagine synthase (glutamine-hydrolysing)
MCGFLFAINSSYTKDELDSRLKLIKFRGPDSSSSIFKNNYYLGHNRLKIIDLSNSSTQPFTCSEGKFAIAFNGEIYNYKEIASRFNLKTRTTSDTEVLLELYKKLGEKCLEHLNGMFAFVIVELSSGNFFIARDRLGVKPIYQYTNGDESIYCSEPAPILNLISDNTIDPIGLRQYLKLRSFFNNRTIYKKISTFPAAHFKNNQHQIRYWSIPEEPKPSPTDEELEELIISSIKYRLISDVTIGSFLSGGLDSSIVTAIAKTEHSWTIGYPTSNEFEWANNVSNFIKTSHHEILTSSQEFLSTAEFMIKTRQEPLSVPNEVLLYQMSKQMQPTNKVVLCGEGADELFFGYDRIFRWATDNTTWNTREFEQLYCYGTSLDNEIIEDALGPFMYLKKPSYILGHFFQIAHLSGLLRRLDFATMLASVEAREPFVDYRLIERMSLTSDHDRISKTDSKIQLKRIFSKILPAEIINRKKVGFPVPLSSIFNAPPERAYDSWLEFNLKTLFNLNDNYTLEDLKHAK